MGGVEYGQYSTIKIVLAKMFFILFFIFLVVSNLLSVLAITSHQAGVNSSWTVSMEVVSLYSKTLTTSSGKLVSCFIFIPM